MCPRAGLIAASSDAASEAYATPAATEAPARPVIAAAAPPITPRLVNSARFWSATVTGFPFFDVSTNLPLFHCRLKFPGYALWQISPAASSVPHIELYERGGSCRVTSGTNRHAPFVTPDTNIHAENMSVATMFRRYRAVSLLHLRRPWAKRHGERRMSAFALHFKPLGMQTALATGAGREMPGKKLLNDAVKYASDDLPPTGQTRGLSAGPAYAMCFQSRVVGLL